MFDVEQGIALQAMQGKWASSHSVGEGSWFFSSCGVTWDIFSSYNENGPLKFVFFQ